MRIDFLVPTFFADSSSLLCRLLCGRFANKLTTAVNRYDFLLEPLTNNNIDKTMTQYYSTYDNIMK